jgi:hypothetical protein
MVRAILAGQKTMTRRIVKPQPVVVDDGKSWVVTSNFLDGGLLGYIVEPQHCKVAQPGGRLWVKETHQFCDEQMDGYQREDPTCVLFRADMKPYRFEPTAQLVPNQHADEWRIGPWRPSIYLPRWASRITLEVTGVRIERLMEITPEDAGREGIGLVGTDDALGIGLYGVGDITAPSPVEAFRKLWESIHGTGSWELCPWIWVISFRRV